MAELTKNVFKNLMNLDVREEVAQDYKGLNYLSWASAYQLMMEQDPSATYEVVKSEDGMPFFTRGDVHMVFTRVTMHGVTKEMWLPVMDNKHNAVKVPSSREVSDNIMRCLVKNIAMFGIGLRLFKKEGLDAFQADDAQLQLIARIMKDSGMTKDQLEEQTVLLFNKDSIRLLTRDEANDFIKHLKSLRRESAREQVSNATTTTPKEKEVAPTQSAPVEVKPEIVEEVPVEAPAQPVVEVEVSETIPAPAAMEISEEFLSADQYKDITKLYREKQLTKEKLKDIVTQFAPSAKGVKELTVTQAQSVIDHIQSI